MQRIFFDTNTGSLRFGYLLHFDQSLADLKAMGDELIEGAKVVIYDPGELEMDGFLTYDHEYRCWKAVPVPGSIRHCY
jgi:hypothetical protein